MLEDLEVFMAVEVVLEEDGATETCFVRSWSPGLGSPTLVAPDFIMAVLQRTTPEREEKLLLNNLLGRYPHALKCLCIQLPQQMTSRLIQSCSLYPRVSKKCQKINTSFYTS